MRFVCIFSGDVREAAQSDIAFAEQQESEVRQEAGQEDEEPDEVWQGFGRPDDR